ncbi:MAG: hypothetical protein EAZ09_12575 [Oscillatoriales cyanobacterium]|nr:MAG: hypothetical protein EAZ09_12575 [Oscillatoriales cyanobacterium]
MRQQQAFRPVPQRVNFLVEQAGKPVHKRLVENGAISQFQPTLAIRQGFQSRLDSRAHRQTWRAFRLKLTPMGNAVSLPKIIGQ